MKKVLIISTSLRNNSNSEILANQFYKGAVSSNNEVEYLTLKDKKINYCLGCLACQKIHRCVINDDVSEIIKKINESDVIVFASPIYFYEMAGQMKTLLDRTNPLYVSEDRKFKDIYFIATCAEDDNNALNRATQGLEGWIECFDDVSLKGVIYGIGVNDPNEINSKASLLEQAFNMGKSIN